MVLNIVINDAGDDKDFVIMAVDPSVELITPNETIRYDFDSERAMGVFVNKLDSYIRGESPTGFVYDRVAKRLVETSSLKFAKKMQHQYLQSTCVAHITEGFASDASGQDYVYMSSELDQQNLLIAATVAAKAAKTWTTTVLCVDDNDVWAHRSHTRDQVIQLLDEMHEHINTCRRHYAQLRDMVDIAINVDDVRKITWE